MQNTSAQDRPPNDARLESKLPASGWVKVHCRDQLDTLGTTLANSNLLQSALAAETDQRHSGATTHTLQKKTTDPMQSRQCTVSLLASQPLRTHDRLRIVEACYVRALLATYNPCYLKASTFLVQRCLKVLNAICVEHMKLVGAHLWDSTAHDHGAGGHGT